MSSAEGVSPQSQCDKCGRVSWTPESKLTTAAGNKSRQGESDVGDYRAWRWEWGGGAYVTDIDQVEWREEDGELRAVALLELTCVRGNMDIPPTYFDAILARFVRDFQGQSATRTARALGCDAYIVVWREGLADFWVYNLSRSIGWKYMERAEYRTWLDGKSSNRNKSTG